MIFASSRNGNPNLYVQSPDGTGTAERLTSGTLPEFPTTITPDGAAAIYFILSGAPSISRVTLVSPHKSEPLIQTTFNQSNADLSPDGRWIAYQATDSGTSEVYVRPYPDVNGRRTQVSQAGGTRPVWSRNGKELFYLDLNGRFMSVPIATTPAFSAGNVTRVFDTTYYPGSSVTGADLRAFDVGLDGQRFLMLKEQPQSSSERPGSIVVVLNWIEELKARIPAAK